jgi:hypothetical protein
MDSLYCQRTALELIPPLNAMLRLINHFSQLAGDDHDLLYLNEAKTAEIVHLHVEDERGGTIVAYQALLVAVMTT